MDWRRILGRIEVDWDLYIGMGLDGYWDGNWDGWDEWDGRVIRIAAMVQEGPFRDSEMEISISTIYLCACDE